jgi:hypothetical protein
VLSSPSCASLLPVFIARADSFLRFVESICECDRKVVRLHDPTRSNLGSGREQETLSVKGASCMATAPTLTRRLLGTKQVAAYLSMGEWKLRRLIQSAIFPIVQDHEGGPFLLDVPDLDAYIEGNKHHAVNATDQRPIPIAVPSVHLPIRALRKAK